MRSMSMISCSAFLHPAGREGCRSTGSPVEFGRRRQPDQARVVAQLDQALRHFRRGQHDIDLACRDGTIGHAVELCIVRTLRQGHASHFLDVRQAHRAVAADAGQDDADGALALRFGERAEEQVDRDLRAGVRRGLADLQVVVDHLQVGRRRDDVDVVLLDRGRGGDLLHRHRGDVLEDAGKMAGLLRCEVQDNDKGHAIVGRHLFKEAEQGFGASRRSAEADDRKLELAEPP